MEAEYYAARANLRRLMRLHPRWTQPQYAQAVGMELRWAKRRASAAQSLAGPQASARGDQPNRDRAHSPDAR